MQTHTALLAAAVRDNARQEVIAEWSSDFTNWHPLQVISGSAGQDRNQVNRWSTSLTCYNDHQTPLGTKAGLHSFGCRIRLRVGVHLLRTNPEFLSYGMYRVDADLTEDRDTFQISGSSFEKAVKAQEFPRPRTIPDFPWDTVQTQVERLVKEVVPDAVFDWDPTIDRYDNVAKATEEQDRWALIGLLMDSVGAEICCGPNGEFVIQPTPSAYDDPAWVVNRGQGGVLVKSTIKYTSDQTYNLVVATGNLDDGTTIIGPAYAWDDDPDSLTYAGPDPVNHPERAGIFGVQPYRFTSPLLYTIESAQKAARTRLRNVIGTRKSLDFTSRFHPGLETGDVVSVEVRDGVFENHLLDSIQYGIGSGTVACGTRTSIQTSSVTFG